MRLGACLPCMRRFEGATVGRKRDQKRTVDDRMASVLPGLVLFAGLVSQLHQLTLVAQTQMGSRLNTLRASRPMRDVKSARCRADAVDMPRSCVMNACACSWWCVTGRTGTQHSQSLQTALQPASQKGGPCRLSVGLRLICLTVRCTLIPCFR